MMTVIPVPSPPSTARTLTAWPRRPAGASSTMSAVATPPTRTSKQTETRRMTDSAVSDGAKALAKFATEKPATPIAISLRRPNRSASVASGRAPRAPSASTEPRLDSPGMRALKSDAIGVAGFSVANFASAFAPSLTALSVIRLVAVCFEALVGGVATALIVEEAPAGRRGQAVSVLAVLGGLGTGITVLIYPLLAPHWRWLFLAGGIGVLAAPRG